MDANIKIMELKSNQVSVNASKEQIISFLSNAENLRIILPQDKISDFQATTESCYFKVQGGITISLVQNGNDENKLYLKSGEKTPFPFNLTVHLTDNGSLTDGYIQFEGEVNTFLKMMVEKPLSALFNYMSEKLKSHFKN
jgi:carbon monoxide dehydrogenase subunit G